MTYDPVTRTTPLGESRVKTLVTGAHGFIGRYTVEALLADGREVLAFDHHQDALGRDWPEGVEVFLGDMRDDVAVTEAMAHVTGWIHLAAVLGTQETIYNPRPAALSNVIGGLNVLEAAAQYDLPGVYICVGNHWMQNTYSITKTTVERFCRMFNADRGTRVNLVRAVNAYGPRQVAATPFGPAKVRKITPAFVCRALTGQPIEVYGDGEQVSDMVYVEDVAETLVRSLKRAEDGRVFDDAVEIGPAEHHTVREVAEEVIRACGYLGYPPVEIVNLPMRPGETPGDWVFADWATLSLVDMHPDRLVTLREGIANTVRWFESTKGHDWHVPG
jgi:UDP-glucose 4-epimerase